ncbi:unnamed protein product [Choristocarpus tenellus]
MKAIQLLAGVACVSPCVALQCGGLWSPHVGKSPQTQAFSARSSRVGLAAAEASSIYPTVVNPATVVVDLGVDAKKIVNGDRFGDKPKTLVDARQLPREEVLRRWPSVNFDVPCTLPEAVDTFLGHSTPRLIVSGVAVTFIARTAACPLGVADAMALPVVAAGWSIQEWAIHRFLLHGFEEWLGYEVHKNHHDLPFYHVSLDPPDLVIAWTIAAATIFFVVLPAPLSLTVLGCYMTMGLVYEWTHYIVHTRVVPQSKLWKALKRHHTLHHLKDDSCWLAFTVPPLDTILGTVPGAGGDKAEGLPGETSGNGVHKEGD